MGDSIDAEGVASRAAAASHLEVDSRALSRARQTLIDKGLLEVAGRGELRFTIPGFDNYLRNTLED